MKARYTILVSIMLLLMIGLSGFASASPPTPQPTPTPITINIGSFAAVDGTITPPEDQTYLFSALPMYIGGKDDIHHPQVATAYLLYNSGSQTMYVQVQVDSSLATYIPGSTTWITIYDINNKVKFTEGPIAVGTGFEASFVIPPKNEPYYIIIHIDVNYRGTATAATIGFQGKVGLPIFVVPEYLFGGLAAIAACFMGFAAFKSRSSIRTKLYK